MEIQNKGRHSFAPAYPPVIKAWASTAGKKESQGPLRNTFDNIEQDNYFGEKTWEQAEQKMQYLTLNTLLKKANISKDDVGLVVSGDLLNQCVGSAFTVRNLDIPHLGLYGACSTMAEGLVAACMAVSGGFCDNVIAITSSHFASAERQYRFPLAYGGQRTPTSQWTVTGSGAALISRSGVGPHISGCTIGTVVDYNIIDANNMGAAMAPAAWQTIRTPFEDFGVDANHYDMIVTGDLGQTGKELLETLAIHDGIPLAGKLTDCGTLVFDLLSQDVHSGGSGCGCSAITLCGYLLNNLRNGKIKNILFCGTGALLSPTSSQQGLSIPGICHAVAISGG